MYGNKLNNFFTNSLIYTWDLLFVDVCDVFVIFERNRHSLFLEWRRNQGSHVGGEKVSPELRHLQAVDFIYLLICRHAGCDWWCTEATSRTSSTTRTSSFSSTSNRKWWRMRLTSHRRLASGWALWHIHSMPTLNMYQLTMRIFSGSESLTPPPLRPRIQTVRARAERQGQDILRAAILTRVQTLLLDSSPALRLIMYLTHRLFFILSFNFPQNQC